MRHAGLIAGIAVALLAGATRAEQDCRAPEVVVDRAAAPVAASAQDHLERAARLAGEAQDLLAIAELDEAIRLRPALLEARLSRGRAYAELDLQAQAIEDFSRVIDEAPGQGWAPLADAYLGRANAYRDAGRSQEALADYAKAIALRPDAPDADAYFHRAIAWHRLDRFAREQADWQVAIGLDPELYWQFGVVYRHRHLYDELRSDQRTALQHPPDNAKAYFRRAEAYRYRRRPCAAIADYTRALAQRPGYLDARLGRGIALLAAGNVADAIDDLSAVLQRRPAAVAYFYRAAAYERLGDVRAAAADLAAADELSPFNPVVRARREALAAAQPAR